MLTAIEMLMWKSIVIVKFCFDKLCTKKNGLYVNFQIVLSYNFTHAILTCVQRTGRQSWRASQFESLLEIQEEQWGIRFSDEDDVGMGKYDWSEMIRDFCISL